MSRFSKTLKELGKPWLFLGLALILVILNVAVLHLTRPYNSDDVFVQTLIHTWHPGQGSTAWLGPDTFLEKVPFYWIIDASPLSQRQQITAAALLFILGCFGLFYYAYRRVVRPQGIAAHLPMVWLAAQGPWFYIFLVNPNVRNLEIGAGFALLALAVGALIKPLNSARWPWIILAVIASSVLWFVDPYFTYMIALPFALFCLTCIIVGYRQFQSSILLSLTALSLGLSKLWVIIGKSLDINFQISPSRFIPIDELPSKIGLAVKDTLYLFHADFFGLPVLSLATIHAGINLILLIIGMFAPLWIVQRSPKNHLMRSYFLAQPWVVLAVFILSQSDSASLASSRYLILLPFFVAINLAFVFTELRWRRGRILLALLLMASTLLNIGSSLKLLSTEPKNPNDQQTQIIHSAQQRGYSKGFGEYWDGNITTYLSNYNVTVLPVECGTGVPRPFYWLFDDQVLNRQADKSFYIFNLRAQNCNAEQIAKRFGEPSSSDKVNDYTTIMYYDHDITRDLLSP